MADLVTQVALLADVDAKVTTNGANENTGARVNANLHNIVDTLWNHAGIAGVDVGTCLFVNATTGNNTTGVRGRMDLQFETIDGALAASGLTAGDTIIGFGSGIYSVTTLVTLNINFYFPNATISGPVKLAVNDVEFTAVCKILKLGVLSVDGVGDPTTGTKATVYADSSTSTIRAAGVTVYGGHHDTIIGGDLYCNLYGVQIGSSLSVESGLMVNSVMSGTLTVNNSGNFNCALSSIAGVSCLSPESIGFDGCHFTVPLDPATNFVGAGDNVGITPLLTAFFNYIGPTGDPGTARWGVDDGTFADITKVRLSTTDYNGNDIADYLDAQTSGQLELRTLDYSKRILFTVTGVGGTGVYRTFDVTPVLGSFPINEEFYTFDFRAAGSGSTPQTLADTLVEGQETSGRSIIISEFDGINFEQGVNQVRLKAPATATGSRAQTLQDKDGEIALTSDIPLIDSIGGLVEVAADTTYRLGGPSAFAYTIDSLDVETASGTITVAVKVNGTAVTGLSAVAASSTPASATATAANTVAVGDYLTFVTSSNSGATGLLFGITITRTP